MESYNYIKSHPVFQTLPPQDLATLEKTATEREYRKGDALFREGNQADRVWSIKSGRVHISHHSFHGYCQTNCVLTKGEIFCCIPTMDHGKYTGSAIAASDSQIVSFPLDHFFGVMEKNPTFLKTMLTHFCRRIRATEAKVFLQRERAEHRIADILLQLSRNYPQLIPLTRQEIADIAGTTIETCIRVLSHFTKQGWISSTRGNIKIIELEKIREFGETSKS